jgi:hypothetical protein
MNFENTEPVVGTTWHSLTPSTALHNTNSIFPIVHPNTRLRSLPCQHLSVFLQPWNESESHSLSHTKPLAQRIQQHHWAFFGVYKISSYGTCKREGRLLVLWLHHTTLVVLFIHHHQHNGIETCAKLEYGERTNQPSVAREEGRRLTRGQGMPNQATSRS